MGRGRGGGGAGPGEGVVEEEVSRQGRLWWRGDYGGRGGVEEEEAMVEEVTEIRMEEVVVDIEDTKSHKI